MRVEIEIENVETVTTIDANGATIGARTSDILFQDAAGNYSIWEIGDNKIVGGGTVGNPGSGWTFKGMATSTATANPT